MSKLENKIQEDMVEAMKNKNEFVRDTLRIVKSEIGVFKTSEKFIKRNEDITDEDVQGILEEMVKRNRKNIDTAKAANRDDIVKKNEDEISVFESYLPKKMTESEIEEVVVKTIQDLGATSMKDMGKVMGFITKTYARKVDGSVVSRIVKSKLN